MEVVYQCTKRENYSEPPRREKRDQSQVWWGRVKPNSKLLGRRYITFWITLFLDCGGGGVRLWTKWKYRVILSKQIAWNHNTAHGKQQVIFPNRHTTTPPLLRLPLSTPDCIPSVHLHLPVFGQGPYYAIMVGSL
jgi:hypothetical protein